MEFVPGIYRNKKNGKLYHATGVKVDCTNERDGTIVVDYGEYVRELGEFVEKFELVQSDPLFNIVYKVHDLEWRVKDWERSKDFETGWVTVVADRGTQTIDLQTFHLLTKEGK